MSAARVTVVTVTYNSADTVGQALLAMKASVDAGLVADYLVVDNLSRDGTPALVRREHPWVTLIETGENLGFGRGCNVGIARARTPYVLLLNPDAELPREALARLVEFLEATPRAGVAAPAIRQPNGRLQFSADLPTPLGIVSQALGLADSAAETSVIGPGSPPARAGWVCGAVVLLRRAMLDAIGGFDPRYFLYFEETDLWHRAADAGWEIWTVGEAVASHVQGSSSGSDARALWHGCIPEHYFESRFHYLTEHFGRPAAVAAELGELGALAGRAAIRALRGQDVDLFLTRIRAPILRRPALRGGAVS